MSWRYKLYNIQPEQVVTIDSVNDNFQPFVGELTGGLNEHNRDATTFTVSEFADDMCLRLHLSRPDEGDVSNGNRGYNNPDESGWVGILPVDGWQSFTDDGLYKSFVGRGGSTWICASFNIHCGTNGTHIASGASGPSPPPSSSSSSRMAIRNPTNPRIARTTAAMTMSINRLSSSSASPTSP